MASSDALEIDWSEAGTGPGPVAPPPRGPLAEPELVARLRRGDAAAFELLVRMYQDRLYDFCYRMLADREEASDLVQEIFVRIHQSMRKFRQDSKLSTWIYRIGKNHCLNRLAYLRRRGRGRSREFDNVSEALLVGSLQGAPKPDDALSAKRERELVQRAIEALDPEQRLVVALRDIEGLSYEEIAEITELPEGTVKSRIHRAREKLAGLIGPLEG